VKRLVVALCLLVSGWLASTQSELPPRVLQLAELKRNIKTRLARLPNDTYLETTELRRHKNTPQEHACFPTQTVIQT